jgi:hypothetical protein
MLLVVLLATSRSQAAGQQATLGPVPVNAALLPAPAARDAGGAEWAPDSIQYPRTYWAEAGLVGGLALGTLSALVAGAWCGDPDSGDVPCGTAVVGGFLVGGAVGFTIGALVGGSVAKPPPEPAGPGPVGTPVDSGRAVSGRLLGTAILVPTGIAVGLTSSNSLGGALIGGLAGFAAGQLLGTLIDRQRAPHHAR